jgi:hypothetical protein
MQRIQVGLGIDRYAAQSGVPASARHPDGDLAAIGDENLVHEWAPSRLPGV